MTEKRTEDTPIATSHLARRVVVPALAVLLFVLAAYALSPMLGSGFISDDLPNSFWTQEGFALRQTTLAREVAWNIEAWWQNGRFNPLSTYVVALFYMVDRDATLYHAFLLGLNLAVLGLFALFVRRLMGSKTLALLVLALVPMMLQFRVFEDPMLAFAGLLQVVFLWSLLSLLALLSYLDTGKRRYLALSLTTYLCALLTYEVVVPFFLLAAIVIWLYPQRRSLREVLAKAWPFAALAVVNTIFVLGIRMMSTTAGAGDSSAYVPNLDLPLVATTFLKQTWAAAPFAYRLGEGAQMFTGITGDMSARPFLSIALFAGVAVLSGLTLALSRKDADSTFRPVLGVWIAIGLIVLPSTLIVLSPRYQQALQWGLGYLPVYISAFGVALLLALALRALVRGPRSRAISGVIVVVLAMSIAAATTVSHFDNRRVVAIQNSRWLTPLEFLKTAADRGLFDGVPDGIDLYAAVTSDLRYDPPGFYATELGLRARLVTGFESIGSADMTGWQGTPSDAAYYTARAVAPDGTGSALVGRVTDHSTQDGTVMTVIVEDLRVYVAAAEGASVDDAVTQTADSLGIDLGSMDVTASGSGWLLLRAVDGYRCTLAVH